MTDFKDGKCNRVDILIDQRLLGNDLDIGAADDTLDENGKENESKPSYYRQKFLQAQLLDEARIAIIDDKDFVVNAEERLLEDKQTIDEINRTLTKINAWREQRQNEKQTQSVDAPESTNPCPESEGDGTEFDLVNLDQLAGKKKANAEAIKEYEDFHTMKHYVATQHHINCLRSLEELTHSPFNYIPFNCMEKYSSLFKPVAKNEEARKSTAANAEGTNISVFTFTGHESIKDTMMKKRQGLFHDYIAENEMYRLQQESRQSTFMETMQHEREFLASELKMNDGMHSLRHQLLEFSSDLDKLLDEPMLSLGATGACTATVSASSAVTRRK